MCAVDRKQTWQPVDFRPTDKDILCGRNKAFRNHPGNVFFLTMIKSNLQRYADSPTRYLKGNVVAELQEKLFEAGARFVKQDKATNRWYQMDKNSGHEKIGHAIRDNLKRLQKTKNGTGKVINNSKVNTIATKSNPLFTASNAQWNGLQNHNDDDMARAVTPSTQTRFASNMDEKLEENEEGKHDNNSANARDSICLTNSFFQDPAPGLPQAQIKGEYHKPVHCASSVFDSLRLMQSDLCLDLFNEDSTYFTNPFTQEPTPRLSAQIEVEYHHRPVCSASTAHDSLRWIQTDLCLDLSKEESLENFQF